MYGLIKISDHHIVAINRGNSTMTVRQGKSLQTVCFRICADNFKKEHGTSNGACIGDRNPEGKYFCLYTSGMKTMVCFKRLYIFNLSGKKLLSGSRIGRFFQLQKIITQLGYTTYDLT